MIYNNSLVKLLCLCKELKPCDQMKTYLKYIIL